MSRSARLLPAATAGLAMVATLLVSAPPGQAATTVSESYTVPADGLLRLTGHGYGHGHGMSQYGAQGAAKQGLTHQQILSFYYPGTATGSATGPIRVLITADTDNDVRVVPASGLQVREVSSGATYALPATAGIKTWRLRTVGGATTLDYDNGSWNVYRPGGTTLSGAVEFFRAGNLTLRYAGTTRTYRGTLRLASNDTVNVLPLDEYVKGVVPREMPTSWMTEAVRSQAVAARTYAAWEREAHSTRYYQTCDTTACQVYGGVGDEDSRGNAAVDATAGKVLTYGGKPAFTQFSSSSGGWLSAGSMPYLVAKADTYDGFSGNPMHTWSTTVSKSAVQSAWPSIGAFRRVVVTQRDGKGEWQGRVEQMRLVGAKGTVTITGDTFRSRLGLRSKWFRFGAGASTPAPAPAPATPIMKRWKAIGGATSVVGKVTGPERAVAGGRVRPFQKGRIFYKAGVGAHELFGKVHRAYTKRGGAGSRLGFPETRPKRVGKRVTARFEHGTLAVRPNGKVVVTYSG